MAVAFSEIDIFKLFKTFPNTSGRLNGKFVLRILAHVREKLLSHTYFVCDGNTVLYGNLGLSYKEPMYCESLWLNVQVYKCIADYHSCYL